MLIVHTVSVTVEVPPGGSETDDLPRLETGPAGDIMETREMVPLKLLRLVRVTVEVAHEP